MENRTRNRRIRNEQVRISMEEAREGLVIDQDGIFQACLNQAELYEKIGKEAVYALSERDQAKAYIAEVRAIKIKEVHEASETKLTVQQAEAAVENDPAYREAVTAYQQKRLIADKWQNMKAAYEQRNSMLKKLADYELSRFRGDHVIKDMRNTSKQVEASKAREAMNQMRRRT